MKVLQCIPGMGGGGAERQLASLAGPLIARGWEVHVALGSGGPNMPRLQRSGATIHRLMTASSYDPRLVWQLARLVRRIRPDLVQVWLFQMEVLAGAVSTVLGVPWILSERSSTLAYPGTGKNRLRVLMARRAAAIISNSSGGDAYWRERVGPHVRRFVVPNALLFEEINEAAPGVPPGLQVHGDWSVVLSIVRFAAEKNLFRLLSALERVVQRPRTVAILAGDGPLRVEIQRRIARVNLSERILTPGYVSHVWPLLKRADVLVAASTFEGRPNAVLEAMAAERPLVVSDIAAHREILDEQSALWVDPTDVAAIAAAVMNVLTDPVAAATRAASARARASGWSIAAAAAEYDSAYRRVLADGRRSLSFT